MNVTELISELLKCDGDSEVTVDGQEIGRVVIWPDGVVIESEVRQ